MGQNASKPNTHPSQTEQKLTLSDPASTSISTRSKTHTLPIPSINIIRPNQVTPGSSRSHNHDTSLAGQGGRKIEAQLPGILKTDLFSSVPLTYLTPSVPLHLRQIILLHGGRLIRHPQRAELLLAHLTSDPALARLYSSQVVVYDSNWIQDSFLAGSLLPCGDYVIYPWDAIAGERFFPFTLAELLVAAGIPDRRNLNKNDCDNEGTAKGYEVSDPHPVIPESAQFKLSDNSTAKITCPKTYENRPALTSISPNIKLSTTPHGSHYSAPKSAVKHNIPEILDQSVPYYQMQPKIAVSKRKIPIYEDSVSSGDSRSASPGPASKRIKKGINPSQHLSGRPLLHSNYNDGASDLGTRTARGSTGKSIVLRSATPRDDIAQTSTPTRSIPPSPFRGRSLNNAGVSDHDGAKDTT